MKIEIEKIVSGGYGIGKSENGRIFFVKKTVPGDIVDVEILKNKGRYAFAKTKQIIKSSIDRIEPPCKYFYHCGGCDHQNISYSNQLQIKSKNLIDSLEHKKISASPENILSASKKEFYYRNSIRFMFVLEDNQIAFARHGYPEDILQPVDFCMLQSETSNEILNKIKNYINKNIKNKISFWQLKIREGKQTAQIMVEIITTSDDLPNEKGIVEELKKIPSIKSIYHTIAPAKSLLKLRRRLIFGSPIIFEKIGLYKFQISPESFFQTNSEGVKTLYDTIKNFANVSTGDEILDLYSGTGSIGIYLSTIAKKVVGIESVQEAVRDARDNVKINRILNCDFKCSDSNQVSSDQLRNKIVILDPPRSGLSKKIITTISNSNFKKLIYVSCNPATFIRDLKIFSENGVQAKKIQPIDMFPQTHHLELVSELIKSK